MALRTLRVNNDEILRKKSKPVKVMDERLHVLLDDMAETMDAFNGLGIAAVQVGVLRRVVLVDVGDEERNILEIVNPEIIEMSGEQVGREGCLSVPNKAGMVKRPCYIRLKYQDRDGNYHELEAENESAVPFFHELDHLEGILYTDKLVSPLEEDNDFEEDEVEEDGE